MLATFLAPDSFLLWLFLCLGGKKRNILSFLYFIWIKVSFFFDFFGRSRVVWWSENTAFVLLFIWFFFSVSTKRSDWRKILFFRRVKEFILSKDIVIIFLWCFDIKDRIFGKKIFCLLDAWVACLEETVFQLKIAQLAVKDCLMVTSHSTFLQLTLYDPYWLFFLIFL